MYGHSRRANERFHINNHVRDFSAFLRTYLFVRALFGGTRSSRHGKSRRTH